MAQALAEVLTKTLELFDRTLDVFVNVEGTNPLTTQGLSLVQAIAGAATILTSAIADVISGQIASYG